MYSKTEMLLLHGLCKGATTVPELSVMMKVGKVQTYRTITSLKEKGAVRFEDGNVIPQNQSHLYTLMNLMHDSSAAVTLLAGNGLDIIRELREPGTAAEVSVRLGVSQRTVSRSIKRMRNVGMLSKEGDRYSLNKKMWRGLRPLADRYADYWESFDERVPPGSRIYRKSPSRVVFSNDRDLKCTKTAFSIFGEYGITSYQDTHYYCDLPHPPTIRDVMIHCFDVIEAESDWRLRMMALIFYKKNRKELEDMRHHMKDEMELVLRTKKGRVEGWVPLWEMQERAEMYGVDLYD
jgi:predicted transcriptional regulator